MLRNAVVSLLLVVVACESRPTPGAVGYNPPTNLSDNCEAESLAGMSECPPVPTQATYDAKGLWTYPNVFSNVPDGAFSRATDAVIRRPGFVETRRGFAPATNTLADTSARLTALSEFTGTLVGHDSTGALSRFSGGAWTTYPGTYSAPEGRRMRFLQTAKSLYFTTSAGVKRLDEVTGTVFSAGVPQATGGKVVLDGTTGFLPAGSQTAYRFVWGIRNANDRVILGAPSGRVPLTNPSTTGAGRNVLVTVSVPSWVTTSHFLQVYRADTSALETVPAGDDMNLAYEAYPNQAQIDAGELEFTDVTPDELKGAALYSSPNAGVPGSEKFEPPVCVDLADYKSRMWCAATTQRNRLLVTLLSVDSASGGLGGGEGLTFTMGGVEETYLSDPTEDVPNRFFALSTGGSASSDIAATAQSLVNVINGSSAFLTAYYASGEYDSPGQVLVEAKDLGAAEFTVKSTARATPWVPAMQGSTVALDELGSVERTTNVVTVKTLTAHGFSVGQVVRLTEVGDPTDAANFPLGLKTVSAVITPSRFQYVEAGADAASVSDAFTFETETPPLESDDSDAPNGLAYSEYAEPDAVPLGNYLEAGSANYRVQRIVALGSALFIFKEDGVFTLTGDSPETFNVQAFPTPAKVVAPDTVAVLGNSIYALTDQGVMVFTESGAQVISRPIENVLLPLYSGSTEYASVVRNIAFAVPYETEREYHLWVPTNPEATFAGEVYVFNYATQAWTKWTTDASIGHVLSSSGVEHLADPSRASVLVERKTLTAADYQDATGVPIVADIAWQVRTGGDPSSYKLWQKVTAYLDTVNAPTTVTLSLKTEVSSDTASGPFSVNGLPYVTTYVPVNQSRSQTLTVGVTAGQVGKNIVLRGLAVDYTPSSTKLR